MPGLLDERLLLARDAAGTLRCLSNVCTHRGMPLVNEATSAEHIRCGYHGRRFDLAGRMLFAPGFEGACDFPSGRDHLPQPALAEWRGHAFVALAPASPFTLAAIEGHHSEQSQHEPGHETPSEGPAVQPALAR